MAAVGNVFYPVSDPTTSAYSALATTVFYTGQFVGRNASNNMARPLVAGDMFLGLFDEQDQTNGQTRVVRVVKGGSITLPLTTASWADLGKSVYASDDSVFTYTSGSNSYIGHVENVVPGVSIVVRLTATRSQLTALTAATGTASDTIADVTASFSQSVLNNNFKSISAKVNELIKILRGF